MTKAESTLALETLAARLGELEQANSALRAEVAQQRDELVRLQADRTTEAEAVDATAAILPAPITPTSVRQRKDGHHPPSSRRTSRRTLLQLGGAAAAATVAAGVLAADHGAAHAAPARTDTTTFQQSANGGGNTAIEGDGTSGADGVHGTSDTSYGVWGSSNIVGVYGTSSGYVGVSGYSHDWVGVRGEGTANTGVGGWFVGGRAALSLGQGGAPGAPTSGGHFIGDIYLDSLAVVWVCVATGTPGTWMRLAGVANGTSGGATTFLSTPIRLLDTRPGYLAATHPSAPLQPGAFNTFHLAVAGVAYGGVTIPSNAQALVGNCTVVNPAGVGDLAVYPDLLPRPNTAVMHYLAGQIVSNGITIGLGSNGKLAIAALSNATDVIIDCHGFIS